MIEIEVEVPKQSELRSIAEIVERACLAEGLTLTLKGTLKKYPHSLHWHFKQGKSRGTLEVTWWEEQQRLWFKLAAGRMGQWTVPAADRLKARIQQTLGRQAASPGTRG